jgi:hypothetical protein
LLEVAHEVGNLPPRAADRFGDFRIGGAKFQPHPAGIGARGHEPKQQKRETSLSPFRNEISAVLFVPIQSEREVLQHPQRKTAVLPQKVQ